MTWEVQAPKETVDSQGPQVSPGPWVTQAQKDRKDKKAAWEILAWKDPWAREGEKDQWDHVGNLALLGQERKETEELPATQGFQAHLESQVLWVPKVPMVLLAPRGPQDLQVPKGSEVKWGFQVSKVTKGLWDHQDPKVTMARKDPVASQASLV